jgi:predicted outer membrane repeat protein
MQKEMEEEFIMELGGSLVVTETNFSSNSAGGSGSGGGIYTTGGNLTTTECIFLNNIALSGSGGAMYKTGSNDIVVIGRNTYDNNTAYYFGGAVYVLGTNSSISVFDIVDLLIT